MNTNQQKKVYEAPEIEVVELERQPQLLYATGTPIPEHNNEVFP